MTNWSWAAWGQDQPGVIDPEFTAPHSRLGKTLADALLLRNHVIERFERADVEPDRDASSCQLLTFVIVGGGLVGVELFGELTAFVDGIVPLYRNLNRDEVKFFLLQGGDRIMPEIDPTLAAYGASVLASRPRSPKSGPRLLCGPSSTARVPFARRDYRSRYCIVLAAGIVPNPLLASLPVVRDKRGHIVVDGTMRCQNKPEVWAIGDCASIPAPDGKPYPNPGPTRRLREAKALAKNPQLAALTGQPPQPFVYDTMVYDGLHWPQEGVRPTPQGTSPRHSCVVHSSHILLGRRDAGLGPAIAHHDGLGLCTALPSRHRQDQPRQRGSLVAR